ncbi:MAG TPA: class I SAM-dependent methyltransferase [Marmoricola sp.]|jgi:SAM-dependent methyltransferase|nr:class I SAM-dependent methyltransferase [Marmoricola sp.]
MSEHMPDEVRTTHGRSFAAVSDEYDRSRPSYPAEAVDWLIGSNRSTDAPLRIVELGAGTGKLTELLVATGHQVLATDPLPEMLDHLQRRLPGTRTAVATAEAIPVASGSIDVVVCAQSFHWFDHDVALPEIARVLRPGGVLALVWNVRDKGIPWVRKLGTIIGNNDADRADLVDPLEASEDFDFVDTREYRFWQSLRKDELLDLVRSRSYIAVAPEAERADILHQVGALYDDYGRGPDGMQLPYLTRCFRSVVLDGPRHKYEPEPSPVEAPPSDELQPSDETQPINRDDVPAAEPRRQAPPEDPGTTLISFT